MCSIKYAIYFELFDESFSSYIFSEVYTFGISRYKDLSNRSSLRPSLFAQGMSREHKNCHLLTFSRVSYRTDDSDPLSAPTLIQ